MGPPVDEDASYVSSSSIASHPSRRITSLVTKKSSMMTTTTTTTTTTRMSPPDQEEMVDSSERSEFSHDTMHSAFHPTCAVVHPQVSAHQTTTTTRTLPTNHHLPPPPPAIRPTATTQPEHPLPMQQQPFPYPLPTTKPDNSTIRIATAGPPRPPATPSMATLMGPTTTTTTTSFLANSRCTSSNINTTQHHHHQNCGTTVGSSDSTTAIATTPIGTMTHSTSSSICSSITRYARAELFLQRIRHNHHALLEYNPDNLDMNFNNFTLLPCSLDLVERVFAWQDEYNNYPTTRYDVGGGVATAAASSNPGLVVDIGYHYTKRTNLPYIQTYGLLTKAERRALNIPKMMMTTMEHHSNGGTFGDGIYTGNNPFSYHAFAGSDVCIFTARLKGTTVPYQDIGVDHNNHKNSAANTILGRAGGSDEVCVLKSSAQCIPLVWFYSSLVNVQSNDHLGNTMIHEYHVQLQRIMDESFHNDHHHHPYPNVDRNPTTMVPRILPSTVLMRQKASQQQQQLSPRTVTFQYRAPTTLRRCRTEDCVQPVSTTTPSLLIDGSDSCRNNTNHHSTSHDQHHNNNNNCSICWNPLRDAAVVELRVCRHVFHEHCIATSLNTLYSCPLCRACVGIPQGTSPSGTMQVVLQPNLHCLGHAGMGCIVITYDLPAGVQASYHDHPGVPYPAIQRIAYLPNTDEGRRLLKRLKFAFCNGLCFTVGTSLTTGEPNRITWASIHHKTSLYCGPYGYPDPAYFTNVHEELDQLHVPKADDL